MGWILLLLVLIVVGVVGLRAYNGLVAYRARVEQSYANIDVQLKRRHDLLPKLVATVEAVMTHEQDTLTRVTVARAAAQQAVEADPVRRARTEDELSAATQELRMVEERYPELQSSANAMALQREISETEDQIAAARRLYNGNVTAYNTRRQSFPGVLVAGLGGFEPATFFKG